MISPTFTELERMIEDDLGQLRKEMPTLTTAEEYAWKDGFKTGVTAILLRNIDTKKLKES
jgi:hypothetical protein